MKKHFKKIIFVFIFLILGIGIYLIIPRNNIECSYTIEYDDYNIKYTDSFYYDSGILTSINHSTIYKFNKDSTSNTTKIYDTLVKNYLNYNDIILTSKVSEKQITFNFKIEPERTSNNTYNSLLGIPKDFILNNYKEEIINRYKLDYSNSTCKMIY